MTPEGRQQIERRMAEAEQFCRDWKYEPAARWRSLMEELIDSLALLLADALPQVTEKKETYGWSKTDDLRPLNLKARLCEATATTEDTDTRVDPIGDSTDTPTASVNETTRATITPTHESNEVTRVTLETKAGRFVSVDEWNKLMVALSQKDLAIEQFEWLREWARTASDADFGAVARAACSLCAEGNEPAIYSWMYLNHWTHGQFRCNVSSLLVLRAGGRFSVPSSREEEAAKGKPAWTPRFQEYAADGNQPPSGLRGDLGAPRTVDGEARDPSSSSSSAVLPRSAAQEEDQNDDTRMDRLSTSSVTSRTAASDVAEGARSMTPDQKRNERC